MKRAKLITDAPSVIQIVFGREKRPEITKAVWGELETDVDKQEKKSKENFFLELVETAKFELSESL